MKLKHIFFALLTLAIIGVCIASPFVVSVFDNNRLLSQPMAETAEAVDTDSLNAEKWEMSHAEKIQLYIDYSKENSSVTRNNNKQNHTLLNKQEAAAQGKEEIINLFGQLKQIPEELLNVVDDLYMIDCQTLTYMDQSNLSRHAIFWLLGYEIALNDDDMMYVSIMMDDETGKIYQFAFGTQNGSWGEPVSTVDALIAYSHQFADYLGVTVEWPTDFYSLYQDPFGGDAYILYHDPETNLDIPYQVALWSKTRISFTLPSDGNAIAEIVYYMKENDIAEKVIG